MLAPWTLLSRMPDNCLRRTPGDLNGSIIVSWHMFVWFSKTTVTNVQIHCTSDEILTGIHKSLCICVFGYDIPERYKIVGEHTRVCFVCWQNRRVAQYITRANIAALVVAYCALRIRTPPTDLFISSHWNKMFVLWDMCWRHGNKIGQCV